MIQQLCEQKSKGWRDLSNPFFVADTTSSCNEVQQLGGRLQAAAAQAMEAAAKALCNARGSGGLSGIEM